MKCVAIHRRPTVVQETRESPCLARLFDITGQTRERVLWRRKRRSWVKCAYGRRVHTELPFDGSLVLKRVEAIWKASIDVRPAFVGVGAEHDRHQRRRRLDV